MGTREGAEVGLGILYLSSTTHFLRISRPRKLAGNLVLSRSGLAGASRGRAAEVGVG